MADEGNNFRIPNIGLDLVSHLQGQRAQTGLAQKGNELKKLGPAEKGAKADTRVEDAATDFEALLLHQMFKSMWASVPQDGMLGGGREAEIYRDMFNEAIAKDIAKGQGIGIKAVIARELEDREGSNVNAKSESLEPVKVSKHKGQL